eukprot:365303-Chlamydomonas_euryale.AAC.37
MTRCRYYVLRHTLHPLKDVGLLCFRDLVYEEIKKKTKDGVLRLVEKEREGELIGRTLLKNILGIFIEVGMGNMECYERDFESFLLTDTGAFYQRKAAEWIEQDSCPDYMCKAEQCLKEEEERIEKYLHTSTRPKLLKEVEKQVLSNYETVLLQKEHSGCAALLRDDKTDDLARMFRLFQRIPKGLEPVAEIFREHVEHEGTKLVKEVTEAVESKKEKVRWKTAFLESNGFQRHSVTGTSFATLACPGERPCDVPCFHDAGKGPSKDSGSSFEQQFVRSVIELHDKYLQYVTSCFSNTSLFHKALKEAFESFCNKNVAGTSSAELMASFCDNLLKKGGSEKLTDEALEETLEKVVKLLAYISDKGKMKLQTFWSVNAKQTIFLYDRHRHADLFAEFYRKKLARRLLHDKSSSDDHERSILSRLKQQCGAQFTSKMEGMVMDLTLAREKQQQFDEWLKGEGSDRKLKIDLNVTVLTTGFWPTYKAMDLALPQVCTE